jgi:hypothetical protein
MYSGAGIPEEVQIQVRYRSNGICECHNSRHRLHPNSRCSNSILSGGYFVLLPKKHTPIPNNVRLICSYCYRYCYAGKRRHSRR